MSLTYAHKDVLINKDGNFTLTLPSTPWIGAKFIIHKLTGSNNSITVSGNGKSVYSISGESIVNNTTATLQTPGVSTFIWDVVNGRWYRSYAG
jgi:hypothetical protein